MDNAVSYDKIKEEVSERIHTAVMKRLEELELTVTEFCELVDLRAHVIYHIKSNKSIPSTESLARMCLTLGLDLNAMLAGLAPAEVVHSLKEYSSKRRHVEEARLVFERKQLELEGVLKKVKLNRYNEV